MMCKSYIYIIHLPSRYGALNYFVFTFDCESCGLNPNEQLIFLYKIWYYFGGIFCKINKKFYIIIWSWSRAVQLKYMLMPSLKLHFMTKYFFNSFPCHFSCFNVSLNTHPRPSLSKYYDKQVTVHKRNWGQSNWGYCKFKNRKENSKNIINLYIIVAMSAPNVAVEWVVLLLRIQVIPGSNLCPETGFSQSFKANPVIAPQIRLQSLLSTFFWI
jgi:hypothetical protein